MRPRTSMLWLVAMMGCSFVNSFIPSSTRSSFQGTVFVRQAKRPAAPRQARRSSSSSLSMSFLGSDGGILGVGAPELFTILLVGYFVLGPSDLYKLTKEIGKGIQNFRTLSSDVTKTFENNMESQLQLEELRKAQRELNDAFSFRRSINVDEEAEAFATTPDLSGSSTKEVTETVEVPSDAPPKRKKKRRRVKKKKVEPEVAEANGTPATASASETVPDLEMPAPWDDNEPDEEERRRTEQELKLREERMERLKTGTQQSSLDPMDEFGASTLDFSETTAQEQDRFAQQMSDSWNAQIMANEEQLEPLAKIMERLAILEEEKNAADARLEEEFRLRSELEEKFYKEKRALLEEAAAEVQAGAYASVSDRSSSSGSEKKEDETKNT